MKKKNVKPFIFAIVGAAMILFGLIFVFVSIGVYYKENVYKENGIKVQGTIVQVSEDDVATVIYDVNGNEYIIDSGNYHSSLFRVGKKVNVYYKLQNPSDAVIEITKIIKYIFYGIGIVSGIPGVILILVAIYLKFKDRYRVDMFDE